MSLRGVWTALVTPFKESGEIDYAAYRTLLEDQAAAGIHGVVVCGTTGESPTLSRDEKSELLSFTLTNLKGSKTQIAMGTGSNSTSETVEFSKWASVQSGVRALLVVTPYYNKPSQAGLEAHYKAIANASACDLILYNVPGRTGVSLNADTVARLAEHPRIRAIKEATGNPVVSSEILNSLAQSKRTMDLLSGDDLTYLSLLGIGATGIISVASNLIPRQMVAIQSAFEQGDRAQAMALHQKYFPLFRDLFIESNPAPIKEALAYTGWCKASVRLPLVTLGNKNRDQLHQTLAGCEISAERKPR